MTSCIHPPRSLAEAEQILVCAGGSNWRDLALTGLAFVAVLAFVAFLLWLALRWEMGRP